jgi:hypothetical protein
MEGQTRIIGHSQIFFRGDGLPNVN